VTQLNAAVREELEEREREIGQLQRAASGLEPTTLSRESHSLERRQLQRAAVAFGAADWEWSTHISDGLSLWDVWLRAKETLRQQPLPPPPPPPQPPPRVAAASPPPSAPVAGAGGAAQPAPSCARSPPEKPSMSFLQSVRSLSTGLPIGVLSSDADVDAALSRQEARTEQREDWLISLANRLLEM